MRAKVLEDHRSMDKYFAHKFKAQAGRVCAAAYVIALATGHGIEVLAVRGP